LQSIALCKNKIRKLLAQFGSNFCQMYQLMTILTLLDVTGLPCTSKMTGLMRMKQVYLKVFQRKLRAAHCSDVDYARDRFYKTPFRPKSVWTNFYRIKNYKFASKNIQIKISLAVHNGHILFVFITLKNQSNLHLNLTLFKLYLYFGRN
jgi:hypothetical protein